MDEKQYAVFCRKGSDVDELIECAASPGMQKTKTAFQVEKVVVLSDAEYAIFRKEGFMQDQVFLFENGDYMWFDPSESCWHCLLIKGEHSREGILVEAEGYSYLAAGRSSGGIDKVMLKLLRSHYKRVPAR